MVKIITSIHVDRKSYERAMFILQNKKNRTMSSFIEEKLRELVENSE